MKKYSFVFLLLLYFGIIYLFQSSAWLYFACILFIILLVIWGSFDIGLQFFLKSITRKKTSSKEVAITFDDGPTEYTLLFLDLLKKHNTKATFFCIGQQIEKYPEIFKRIIDEGHCVGNHSYTHPKNMGFLSASQVLDEIKKCDEVLYTFGNIKNSLYRPPFGVTNPNIAKAIKDGGKISIGWNIRSLDTVITDEKKILKRITKPIKKGSIILLHDTSQKTYNVLVELLLFLERENYSTFTITTSGEN
ncbi:MAG: polysaccharide deacetylase family protein [Chryseobacterium sp.]|nr:polysaccharide deacetylase family protein [Candidatus Chryseobacterium enterohippi]